MAKKKKSLSFHITDFFGFYNIYKIFALQSDSAAFSFANKLGHALSVSFTVLRDLEYVSNRISANFTVFYAEYAQKESIHCLLLENKTDTNQQELFDLKTGKNPHLLNYSLFAEPLYLFNNYGLRCLEIPLADIDYLLLLFAKKDIENEMFLQLMRDITPFKAKEISYLLEKKQTASQAKVAEFLKDFYCKYEVKANQFSRKRKMDLLAPVKQIPKQNLQFPIPVILENETAADNLQLSEEYVKFLAEK